MSLLAACVADRVWVKADIATKIYPKLYMFLVGPSGAGKSRRSKWYSNWSRAAIQSEPYAGKMTGPAMWEYLSKSGRVKWRARETQDRHDPQPLCVFRDGGVGSMCEIRRSGAGSYCDYDRVLCSSPLMVDGTRQHGFVKLIDPCVNWLAGTTDEWMLRSVPKDAVEGGFVARVQVVRGQRNYAERFPRMIYPRRLRASPRPPHVED